MSAVGIKNRAGYMAPADLHAKEWTPGQWHLFDPFTGAGLPRAPGVYVFFFDGRPVYIGSSNNLQGRLWQHRFEYARVSSDQHTPWGFQPGYTVITGKLRVSFRYGEWAMTELRLIKRLQPRYNIHHRARRS